jgi:hypothetical protein
MFLFKGSGIGTVNRTGLLTGLCISAGRKGKTRSTPFIELHPIDPFGSVLTSSWMVPSGLQDRFPNIRAGCCRAGGAESLRFLPWVSKRRTSFSKTETWPDSLVTVTAVRGILDGQKPRMIPGAGPAVYRAG